MKHIFAGVLMCIAVHGFSQDHLRFRASIDAALGFGQDINSGAQTIGNGIATVTLGVVRKGLFLGAGTGIFKMRGTKSNDHYMPVYGELSYMVQKQKVAPFFSLKVGKLMPKKQDDNPYPLLNKSTMMYNPSIGLAIDLKVLYVMPFLEYLVPADFDSRFDTFGVGLRILTH